MRKINSKLIDPDLVDWEVGEEAWWVQALWMAPAVLLIGWIVFKLVV